MVDLFGLSPLEATIVIGVIGVLLQTGVGWLKSDGRFDPRQVASSGIIALFTAFAIIMPVLQAVPADADELAQFAVFVGLIGQIAGFDALVKNGAKAVVKKRDSMKASSS